MNPQPVHRPVNWRAAAACLGLWDLYDLADTGHRASLREARHVCATCPVRAACDTEAASLGTQWSVTHRQPRPESPARPRKSCGSYSGYQLHRRYGEPSCEPCRWAAADYRRALRAGSRAS